MTNLAQFSQVTDELLSSYLDQAVTPDEKSLVEAAVVADPMIAWRLESLRQTVQLLRTLPAVALPRSFILTEAQLTPAPAREPIVAGSTAALRPGPRRAEPASSGWQVWVERWRAFWQPGSPVLRNAMAASFALLLVLVMGDRFLATRVGNLPTASTGRSVSLRTAAELPTAELVAVQQAAPASQVTSSEAVASVSDAAATATGAQASVANAPPLAEARLRTTVAQDTAIPASDVPGEDPGVLLDPAGEAGGAMAASGVGGGQESTLTGTLSQSDQPAGEQAEMAATTAMVTAAAFDSPLSNPEQAVALSAAMTTTMAVTAGYAAEPTATPVAAASSSTAVTNAVVITTTSSDPLSTTVVTAPQPLPPSPAADPQPEAAAPAGRIRLLQMVSALVTLLLAGLWWRSR